MLRQSRSESRMIIWFDLYTPVALLCTQTYMHVHTYIHTHTHTYTAPPPSYVRLFSRPYIPIHPLSTHCHRPPPLLPIPCSFPLLSALQTHTHPHALVKRMLGLRRLPLHTQSKRWPDKTHDEWRNWRRQRGNAALLWVWGGREEEERWVGDYLVGFIVIACLIKEY